MTDERDESTEEGTDAADTGASDDSSQDDSSSDDSSQDDSSSESSASAPSASASVESTPSKPSKSTGASAGARLAAAKAAKAAAKAAKKQARRDEAGAGQTAAEREAEDQAQAQSAEDVLKGSPLGRAATRAGEWTQANQQLAVGAVAIAALALVGWLGWTYYSSVQATSAGALLADALVISSAEIVAPDAEEHASTDAEADADALPTYETLDARNAAALAAYRRVSTEYPSSQAAAFARLGEGRTLLSEGEYADARTAYEAAFDHSGDETVVAWQALEGIGASYEAESNWTEATATYERLAALADHAYGSVASYHLARMHAAEGDESAALTSFRELVDTLRADSDEGEPPFPYVLEQADQRLRELDPSAPGAGPNLGGGGDEEGGGAPGGVGDLTPEQLQELIQRFREQGGAEGTPAP